MMIAAASPKLMGEVVLGFKAKLLGWAATAAMAAATIAMFGTMVV